MGGLKDDVAPDGIKIIDQQVMSKSPHVPKRNKPRLNVATDTYIVRLCDLLLWPDWTKQPPTLSRHPGPVPTAPPASSLSAGFKTQPSSLHRCAFTVHALRDDLISFLYVTRPGRRVVSFALAADIRLAPSDCCCFISHSVRWPNK